MDFKKFLKPLAGIALGVAAFASCAVGVKNPVLVDAFEYSTSDPSTSYGFTGSPGGGPFTGVGTVQGRYDYCYWSFKSNLPQNISNIWGRIDGTSTHLVASSINNSTFKLFTGRYLGADNLPFVSLDIQGSSGGLRDVFSIVVSKGGNWEILYCSDPESWKVEYGAAMVYQWQTSEDPTFYLIRAKDFVSYSNCLDSLMYNYPADQVAPDGNSYQARGALTFTENQLSSHAGIDFLWNYPDLGWSWIDDANHASDFVINNSHPAKLNYRWADGAHFLNATDFWIGLYGIAGDGVSSVLLDSSEGSDNYLDGTPSYTQYQLVLYANVDNNAVFGRGYSDGYAAGRADGEGEGYNSGYEDGRSAGYVSGYDEGASVGYSSGYGNGYAEGFHDGDVGAQGVSWNFFSMLTMVYTTPFTIIVNSFNFTFFEGTSYAFNFGYFFWGVFSLLLAWEIFKLVLGFFGGK